MAQSPNPTAQRPGGAWKMQGEQRFCGFTLASVPGTQEEEGPAHLEPCWAPQLLGPPPRPPTSSVLPVL